MPSRSAEQIFRAYSRVHDLLSSKGLKPTFKVMDNEASKSLKDYLIKEKVDYQLVPPDVHRAAERAIRTFKNHLIAGLCSVDPTFPLHLWGRLLPHALLTLNLLRKSRLNDKLSAAQIYGSYDSRRMKKYNWND